MFPRSAGTNPKLRALSEGEDRTVSAENSFDAEASGWPSPRRRQAAWMGRLWRGASSTGAPWRREAAPRAAASHSWRRANRRKESGRRGGRTPRQPSQRAPHTTAAPAVAATEPAAAAGRRGKQMRRHRLRPELPHYRPGTQRTLGSQALFSSHARTDSPSTWMPSVPTNDIPWSQGLSAAVVDARHERAATSVLPRGLGRTEASLCIAGG